MILQNVKKTIFLNAGHYDDPNTPHVEDPGASITRGNQEYLEALEVVKIRNLLIPLLKAQGFKVLSVPDYLNLKDSVAWVNERAEGLNYGLAIDLHLNWNSNKEKNGAEVYYYSGFNNSRILASILSPNIATALGVVDNGAVPDDRSAVGKLYWIRETNVWASLVEFCYLTNEGDFQKLILDKGYGLAARGLCNGVISAFGGRVENYSDPGIQDNVIEVKRSVDIIKLID